MPNIRDLAALLDSLDKYGVPRHPDVGRAIAAYDLLQHAARQERPLSVRLLDLEPDALLDRLTEVATRINSQAVDAAMSRMQSQLTAEAAAIMTEHVPAILAALRPHFDAAAKVVTKAAKAGIRPGMTAEHVIEMDSGAIAAWRQLEGPSAILQDIAGIRVQISQMFGIGPAVTHGQLSIGERVDWTACFTAPASGITAGYGNGNPEHRWLSLALATGGRLRLNDPEETAVILYGEGQSPGWVVCAGSAVVHDDEGRDLILYTSDWLPTWVDLEQVDHLIDQGVVVAARPEAQRPADKMPLSA